MSYLMVLLMLAGVPGQCTRDISSLPAQVAANGLKSLDSLHDYVWVQDMHQIMRDRKGKIETRDYRYQTIVANGQMYSRELQPGEAPELPESAVMALSQNYHASPAISGDFSGSCGSLPCRSYPYVFLQMVALPDFWDVLSVREVESNGAPALVLELRAKPRSHRAFAQTATAWVDPEHCRLLRLSVIRLDSNGNHSGQEVDEFGEVKGNWLPIKRQIHTFPKGKPIEYTEEYTYTYLKFGASVRILP